MTNGVYIWEYIDDVVYNTKPESWDLIRLGCCRKGCQNTFVVNRKQLEDMDRRSIAALCSEHGGEVKDGEEDLHLEVHR